MTTLYALVRYVNEVKGDTLAIYTSMDKANTWIYYNSDNDDESFDIEIFEADQDPDPTP